MNPTARRPLLAAAALTTAGALALTPVIVTPPDLSPASAPVRVSSQPVQLTDAWFDLLNNTLISAVQMSQLFSGANPTYPLPNPIFVAPIATQLLVVNPLTYAAQLLAGQGAQVPTEIIAHINALAVVAQAIGKDIPPAIVKQIQTPFVAVQGTVDYIATAANKLEALFQAPALFVDYVLNSQYGLIGYNGPIAVGLIIRNVVAQSLFTAPPAGLPFKKAAAASKPQAAVKTTAPAAPSGTASSARSKPKASPGSSRKAASAKSAGKSGTHSARG